MTHSCIQHNKAMFLVMYNLGQIYDTGYDGIKLSHERAFEYYDQAAHLGHAQAQYNLGVAYATDDVVL